MPMFRDANKNSFRQSIMIKWDVESDVELCFES